MTTPQHELDIIQESLKGENIELLKDDLAFYVGKCIVKYQDAELLNKMPEWVGQIVHEMCETYRRVGSYVIVSNVGETDHSAMMRELGELLKTR